MPASLGLLLPEFPIERRAFAVGLWGAAAAAAAAIGPTIGGMLVEWADWRWVFLVNVPVGAAALIAARRVLVEAPRTAGPRPDLAGAGLLAAAVGALALALVQGEPWGWGDERVLAAFAAFVVLAPLAVARSARHAAPVLPLELFRLRSFAVANLGTVLFASAFYALLLGNVLFLTAVWGYSVLEAGLAVSPAPIMATVWAGPAGRVADAVGHRAVVVPGALLFAAGAAWFVTRVGSGPAYLAEWLPGAMITGTGVGLAFAALGAAAVSSVPPERFAVASAVSATSRQLGAVLGVALLVAVVGTPSPADAAAAFDEGWLISVGAALLAAAVAVLLRPRAVRAPVAQPAAA